MHHIEELWNPFKQTNKQTEKNMGLKLTFTEGKKNTSVAINPLCWITQVTLGITYFTLHSRHTATS